MQRILLTGGFQRLLLSLLNGPDVSDFDDIANDITRWAVSRLVADVVSCAGL